MADEASCGPDRSGTDGTGKAGVARTASRGMDWRVEGRRGWPGRRGGFGTGPDGRCWDGRGLARQTRSGWDGRRVPLGRVGNGLAGGVGYGCRVQSSFGVERQGRQGQARSGSVCLGRARLARQTRTGKDGSGTERSGPVSSGSAWRGRQAESRNGLVRKARTGRARQARSVGDWRGAARTGKDGGHWLC